MDFHLLCFDREKADSHLRELRFGSFGESCGFEREYSRFGFHVELRVDQAIDVVFVRKNGPG
jgi:hypothetical protein